MPPVPAQKAPLCLPGRGGTFNPGIFKKAAADFLKFLGKRAISVQNRFYRLLPADALVFGKRRGALRSQYWILSTPSQRAFNL